MPTGSERIVPNRIHSGRYLHLHVADLILQVSFHSMIVAMSDYVLEHEELLVWQIIARQTRTSKADHGSTFSPYGLQQPQSPGKINTFGRVPRAPTIAFLT